TPCEPQCAIRGANPPRLANFFRKLPRDRSISAPPLRHKLPRPPGEGFGKPTNPTRCPPSTEQWVHTWEAPTPSPPAGVGPASRLHPCGDKPSRAGNG